jgi:UDP-glucose 4-epimerase
MGSRILVTGGLGFVGSNLVDLLIEGGHKDITVIDSLISESSSRDYMRGGVKYFINDIREIASVFENKKFDTIFHLAALARIQPSFTRPQETIGVNSQGTVNVCEFARKCNAQVVYAGSSSYYGGPLLNPYAFSKWQGEEICKLFSRCFGLKITIARFFNVYGPRQPEEGPYATVIGIFEKQRRDLLPLTITGTGNQRRDFTYVKDICAGLIAISGGSWKEEVFNIGTGTNHSINELADLFQFKKEYIPARPGEAEITLADISKTTAKTGWLPKYDLVEYVRGFLNGL